VYNREYRILKKTFESWANQLDKRFELLVVDDGSTIDDLKWALDDSKVTNAVHVNQLSVDTHEDRLQ
jgi:glycosyltransferase involved in cell wall biosynthesis